MAENFEVDRLFHELITEEFSKSLSDFSSSTTSNPHRVGSASRGVNVKPLPVPNHFQNLILGLFFKGLRFNHIRSTAHNRFRFGMLQKYIRVIIFEYESSDVWRQQHR